MDFSNSQIIFLDNEKSQIPIGTGICIFWADYKNPYRYASIHTLNYLKRTLNLKSETLIEDLMNYNTNINPLKATTIPNLIHCGLIYRLDLLDLIYPTITSEHFTNLRLIIYLISLMPQFGKPESDISHVIRKIAPAYLRYLLCEYYPFRIDPVILNDAEIYEAFETLKIPEKYEIYNDRYQRLQLLQSLRPDFLQILISKLYKTSNLYDVIIKTVQSNLEHILLYSTDYDQLVDKLGMHPLDAQKYDFNADEYILNNFIEYIHYTDPINSEILDLYTAIDKGVLTSFLSRFSDYELIYNITGFFVHYKSRVELIRKLELVCGTTPRFFIKVDESPSICYGNLHNYIQYSSAELLVSFKKHPMGFWNPDHSVQFSIYDINELCEMGNYFTQFTNLINFCKDKIKNLKNKNN
jgi:hypothetical protein